MNTINTQAVHGAVHSTAQADEHIRLPVKLKDGRKTSVSIPRTLFETFVARFGTRKNFRENLNDAVLACEPGPGYSRSQLVRMMLEQNLAAGTF